MSHDAHSVLKNSVDLARNGEGVGAPHGKDATPQLPFQLITDLGVGVAVCLFAFPPEKPPLHFLL